MRQQPDFELRQIATSPYWYIYWSEKGRSRRRSTGSIDRREAEQVLVAFRLAYDPSKKRQLTFAQVMDLYQEAKLNGTRQDATLRGTCRRLKDYFGSTDADDIDLDKQGLFIRWRRQQSVSDGTIKRDLSVLSAALKYAHKRKKINRPYDIETISAPQARERFLTRAEYTKLLRYLRAYIRQHKRYHHLLLFTRIAFRTGQRVGVITSLTWDRVDYEVRNLHMEIPQMVRTNKRQITIGFNHYLERALKAERRRQLKEAEEQKRKPSDHVISFEGQPVKVLRKAFTKACEAAGISGATPITLRHTFGTLAARNSGKTKISLYDISGAMAHSSIATTQRYAKHMPEAHMSVVDTVGRK